MNKLLAAVTVLAVSTAQAATIHVAADCPGGDGSIGDRGLDSLQESVSGAQDQWYGPLRARGESK